jgi:antitoxin component of MazEF toxin-antitoxin module
MGKTTRSVIRFGDSLGVTLPADFSRENNLRPGDRVYVLRNLKSLLVTTDRRVAEELAVRLHERQTEVIKEAAIEAAGPDA